jgi:hypothetical protein
MTREIGPHRFQIGKWLKLAASIYMLHDVKEIDIRPAGAGFHVVVSGQMIKAKRLKAMKVGHEWLIVPTDLEAVKDRKVGRPRKAKKR